MKTILLATLAFVMFVSVQVYAQKLEKLWEVTGLEAPESVIFDSNQKVFYVSNVAGNPTDKDGNGYLSKVDQQGKVVAQKWVTGLNAPKGLGISKGKLYVADIDQVAIVDIATGKIESTLPAAGATFLNDVAVSPTGEVYISDTFSGNSIYRIKDGKIEMWLQDARLDSPNGLFIKGNDIIVASWGTVTNPQTFETAVKGKLVKVSIADKKISDLTKSFSNGDGIASYKNGFVVSDWVSGKIFFVDNKGVFKEIGSYNAGTADLALTAKNQLILPQMMEGKLLAFSLK